MTPRSTLSVRVIGLRSRSPGQKTLIQVSFDHLTGNLSGQGHMGQGQKSSGSRSKVKFTKSKV